MKPLPISQYNTRHRDILLQPAAHVFRAGAGSVPQAGWRHLHVSINLIVH